MSDFDTPPRKQVNRDIGDKPTPAPTPHAAPGPVAHAGPQLQGPGGGKPKDLVSLFSGMFGLPMLAQVGPPAAPADHSAAPGVATAPKAADTDEGKRQQVDAAVQGATKNLSYGLLDWKIKDGEAREAMNTLKGLPPDLQGAAVNKLDPTTFSRLLSEVPEKERAQFQQLVDNCHDPARKLELFAACHKSKVGNDADSARAADPKNGDNDKRDAIVDSTKNEVDAELAFLKKKAADGKLSEAEVQKYIDGKTGEHQSEMKDLKKQTGTLDGLPDADRVAYVQERTEKLLDRSITDWKVTDKEASGALDLLTGLPPNLQGEAIKKLDPGAFDKLLSEVPEGDRERFKTLVDNCPDPERKLKLWGEYHKAKTTADVGREKEKTKDVGSALDPFGLFQTTEQKENERVNNRRDEINGKTKGEVDDEVAFLLKQQKDGVPLTMGDIDKLMARKELEHQVEQKHLVNLINQKGDSPDERATWTEGELQDVMATLDKLPEGHVRKNQYLKEIERRVWKPGEAVADHGGGHINFWGLAAGDQANQKHHRMGGSGIDVIQGTLTHEIGHNLHDYKYKDQHTAIKKQADWQNHATEPAADPGRVVMKNPYGDGWVSYKKGAIPETDNAGTWGYARSNPADQFAEQYTKMVNLPAETQKDMVGEPTQVITREQAKLGQTTADIEALKAQGVKTDDPRYVAAVTAQNEQQARLDDAKNNAVRLQSQYDTMHDQVLN